MGKGNQATILIVDDEDTLSHFLAQALEGEGYRVLRAASGGQGLDILGRDKVDLVLLDMRLPDIPGREVLRRIRRDGESPKVILLSSDTAEGISSTKDMAQELMSLGAQGFLEKPVELALLKQKIAQVLSTATRQELPKKPVAPQAGRAITPEMVRDAQIRRLERRLAELGRLERLAVSIYGAQEVSQVVDLVLEASLDLAAAHRALLWVRGEQNYVLVGAKNIPSPDLAIIDNLQILDEISLLETLVLEPGSLPHSLQFFGSLESLGPSAGEAVSVSSLFFDSKFLGIMMVFNPPGRSFSPGQLANISAIADRAAAGLWRVLAWEDLRSRTEMLREEEKLQTEAMGSMADGWLVADRRGRIIFANRIAEKLLGYGERGLLGQPLPDFLPDLPSLADWQRGLLLPQREGRAVRSDGQELAVEINLRRRQGDQGEILGLTVGFREAPLSPTAEKSAGERLASLRDFSRLLAHEIRNPLAGIGAGVQHLLSKLPKGDKTRGSLEMILKETERVNRLLEEILFLTRPIPLQVGLVDLASILEEAISRSNRRHPSLDIIVEKNFPQSLPKIIGDGPRLTQAFSSIIEYAMQLMSGGGLLQLAATANEPEMEIAILHSGDPIPAQELEKIFDPLATRSAQGLALAVARRIIEAHGWEIEAESQGFILRLPLSRDS